ncbi:MAG: hypothetical protein LBU80_00150 [Rikenellaceae bacterium]|jgi:hypothetical protein|nr:hypothetical protein [Rikenellaceae bacterium]
MRKRPILILTALVALAVPAAQAQNPPVPAVRARVVPDSMAIGDRFRIEVEVEKDLVQVVEFPGYEGTLAKDIEIVSESPVDTLARDGRRVTIRKTWTLTTFEEGIYSIGRFPVLYADKNVLDTLLSIDSLSFMVTTFPIDTLTQTIYDIKAPLRAPVKFAEFGGCLVLGFFVLQLLYAIVYAIVKSRQRRRRGEKVTLRPAEPAHVRAIRELERLEAEKLWQNNRHKLYHTRLTDIVRTYIEKRYGIDAPAMTSDEIRDEMERRINSKRILTRLSRLLSTADHVKFAKYIPGPEDNEMSYNDAYCFVEETKPTVVADEPTERKEGDDA